MTSSQHLPAYADPAIKRALIDNGASGTIYALVLPETRRIVEEVLDGGDRDRIVRASLQEAFQAAGDTPPGPEALAEAVSSALRKARQSYTDIFDASWTSRQDHIDSVFFDGWKNWTKPVLKLPDDFKHHYPTAGASEGLREAINSYAHRSRREGFEPVIHVFHGEYEGFAAYAQAAGIKVVRHDRADWQATLDQIGPTDEFYLSQPSTIDGNVWEDFDRFAKTLYQTQPKARLMADLTYIGSVAREYFVNVDHPNIPTVFFSLSKPFGAYYHRIGGVLSRSPLAPEEYPGLFGNKWFKILQGMQIGIALMNRSTPYDLPRKYRPVQEQALANVNARLGLDLKASDIILLATSPLTDPENRVQQALLRGTPGAQFLRLCLTPEMTKLAPGAAYIDMDNPRPVGAPPAAFTGERALDMTFEP